MLYCWQSILIWISFFNSANALFDEVVKIVGNAKVFWVVFYTDVYIETEIIVIIVIAVSFKYTICRQMGLYRTVLLTPGQGYCLGTGCSVMNRMDQILYHSVLALTNAKGEETIST